MLKQAHAGIRFQQEPTHQRVTTSRVDKLGLTQESTAQRKARKSTAQSAIQIGIKGSVNKPHLPVIERCPSAGRRVGEESVKSCRSRLRHGVEEPSQPARVPGPWICGVLDVVQLLPCRADFKVRLVLVVQGPPLISKCSTSTFVSGRPDRTAEVSPSGADGELFGAGSPKTRLLLST